MCIIDVLFVIFVVFPLIILLVEVALVLGAVLMVAGALILICYILGVWGVIAFVSGACWLGFLIDLYRRHPPTGWSPEIGIATAFLVLGVYAVLLPH